MKALSLVLLFGIVVVVTGRYQHRSHGEGHGHGQGHGHGKKKGKALEHFHTHKLGKHMRMFKLPEGAACSEDVQTCMKNVHMHARRCFQIRTGSLATRVRACRKEDDDVKAADKEWQEASFKWHKGLEGCMKGDPVPEEEEEGDDFMYLFRKKRESEPEPAEGHEDCDGGRGEYTNFHSCWRAMKEHHRTCEAKVIPECPILARCNGKGDVPSDENEAEWYNYMEGVRGVKEEKLRNYRTALFECLDIEGGIDMD
jgi:hypothetical protein